LHILIETLVGTWVAFALDVNQHNVVPPVRQKFLSKAGLTQLTGRVFEFFEITDGLIQIQEERVNLYLIPFAL
jgi:hypothetical protein